MLTRKGLQVGVHMWSAGIDPAHDQGVLDPALKWCHERALICAVHDMARMPILSSISRFHMSILRLLLIVLVWVHWDACLNYGFCAYEPLPKCSPPP